MSISVGSKVLKASDEHYGPANNILQDFDPTGMHDGFESKRSRVIGHTDWVLLKLGQSLEANSTYIFCINMSYFIYNNPKLIKIYGSSHYSLDQNNNFNETWDDGTYTVLVNEYFIKPFRGNEKRFYVKIPDKDIITICVVSIPDGGFNRLKI